MCSFRAHREGLNLLLCLSRGLLQLGLGLSELVLQGCARSLQPSDLGFPLLQGQLQLCQLPLELQFLFFML